MTRHQILYTGKLVLRTEEDPAPLCLSQQKIKKPKKNLLNRYHQRWLKSPNQDPVPGKELQEKKILAKTGWTRHDAPANSMRLSLSLFHAPLISFRNLIGKRTQVCWLFGSVHDSYCSCNAPCFLASWNRHVSLSLMMVVQLCRQREVLQTTHVHI